VKTEITELQPVEYGYGQALWLTGKEFIYSRVGPGIKTKTGKLKVIISKKK
jgi:hypothetical protein